MKYALVKFRVYLLGEQRFVIYTDHASLRTATKTPHLSQRMARWLSFFSEYNFVVLYKPGKSNILADALSRRPDYDPKALEAEFSVPDCPKCVDDLRTVAVSAHSSLPDDIKHSYDADPLCRALISYFTDPTTTKLDRLSSSVRARIRRYHLSDGLLYYSIDPLDTPRIVVPCDDDIRFRLIHEHHDAPVGGHLGREKTYLSLSRSYYWPHQYKWVRKWIRSCEVCQRVKPSPASQAPLTPLPVPRDVWDSVSLDFVFGFPKDSQGRDGVLVFVDRLSKMVHLTAVKQSITAEESAAVFLDSVFRLHGLPETLVSDRDPRFTSLFWRSLFKLLDTKLQMSTAAHPQTDGQTERVNRVLEDVLRSYATSFSEWSQFLPLVEFALNNSVHASTGMSPFYVNYGRHPRVPSMLSSSSGGSSLSGGGVSTHSPIHEQASVNPPIHRARDTNDTIPFVNKPIESTNDTIPFVNRPTESIGPQPSMPTNVYPVAEEPHNTAEGPSSSSENHEPLPSFDLDMDLDHHDDQVHPQSFAPTDHEMVTDIGTGDTDAREPNAAGDVSMDMNTIETLSSVDPESTTKVKGASKFNFDAMPSLSRLSPNEAKSVDTFIEKRQAIVRFIRDSIADAVDRQKEYADSSGRSNRFKFNIGDRVLLSTQNLPERLISHLGSSKLLPRFIGPFKVIKVNGDAYTIDLPKKLRLHPTFYVGRLKPYISPEGLITDLRSDVYASGLAHQTRQNAESTLQRGLSNPSADYATVLGQTQHARVGTPHEKPCEIVQPTEVEKRLNGVREPPNSPVLQYQQRHTSHRSIPAQQLESQHAQAYPTSPISHEVGRYDDDLRTNIPFVRDGPPPLVDADGVRRWVVDRIVDHEDRLVKKKQRVRYYRVHWLGYPDEQDTWEHGPTIVLEVPDLVREYEDSLSARYQRA